jgi:hypothetical protein
MEFNEQKSRTQRATNAILRARYEAEIALNMRRITRHIAGQFEASYAQRRAVPDITAYQDDIAGYLRQTYTKIAGIYKNQYRSTKKADIRDEIARHIDLQLTHDIRARGKQQSEFIIITLEDQLEASLNEIIIEGATQGISLSKDEAAKRAAKKFQEYGYNHADTISTTEFTWCRNYSAFKEASVINEAGIAKLKKNWRSTLDMVTRPAHIFADNQQADIDEPFIVGAENLLFPGDMSMGASVGNVINCRCEFATTEAK